MGSNKPTLYVMIVLFVTFLSLSIYGAYAMYDENKEITNDNKEFYFNGKLYFYQNEELLGTYECANDFCGYATSFEEEYITDYFTGGTVSNLGIINSDYVFLQDGEEIFLYSISLEMKINIYEEIKFYNTYSSENYILVKSDGLWGAVSLTTLRPVISVMYEELSVLNISSYGKLSGKYLLAKLNGESFIITSEGELASQRYTGEVAFADENYIVLYDESYHIYDFEGTEYLSSYTVTQIDYSDNYYVVVWDNYAVVYSYFSLSYIEYLNLNNNGVVTIVEENGLYTIYEDGNELTN